MLDLVSIGDCTIDHTFKIHDAHIGFNVDRTKRELCISYGDKIPVENYTQSVAGNCANHAIACSKLGLKTAVYCNVGSDLAGKRIVEKFKDEGVATRYIKINQEINSNVSSVISFQGERTILVYHQPWRYELPDLERTRWIYFTSVSHTFPQSNLVGQLENYLERTGAKLAFNPGTYQLQYGIKKFPRLLSLTQLLIINVDEARRVLKLEGKVEVKKLLKGLATLGPASVVLTDGKNGSYGFDGEKYYRLEVFPAKVVDMTGAGDAYAAGLVSALAYGKDLPEAMRWGTANGASVIEIPGSQNGLLTHQKMQQKLKENSKIQTKPF